MADRGRPKAELVLTEDERQTLERWARRPTSQALAQRCRIVLGCAAGKPNKHLRDIASKKSAQIDRSIGLMAIGGVVCFASGSAVAGSVVAPMSCCEVSDLDRVCANTRCPH
jgi:hypothetical protein